MMKKAVAFLSASLLVLLFNGIGLCADYMAAVGGMFSDPLGLVYRVTTQKPFVGESFQDSSGEGLTPFQDSVVSTWRQYVFLLGRLSNDTVTVLDVGSLQQDPLANYSVGIQDPSGDLDLRSPQSSSNPHDLVVVDEQTAYMSFFGSTDLLKLNPFTGERLARIDLSSFNEGEDGLPEADKLLLIGSRLHVLLKRQDRNASFEPRQAAIAVVDTRTDTLVGRIDLEGRNPADMAFVPSTNQLLIPMTGEFGDLEDPTAGLEVVDLGTESTLGVQRSVSELGGKVARLVTDGSRGFVLLFDDSVEFPFPYFVRVFDPVDLTVSDEDFFRPDSARFLSDMSLDRGTHLYVVDRDDENPGIRVFNTETGEEAAFVATDVPMYSIAFATDQPLLGGAEAGPQVRETLDTSEAEAFTLLLSRRAPERSGRIYVSLEAPALAGMEDLMFFRSSDHRAAQTGKYLEPGADGDGFFPDVADLYYSQGPLGPTTPDLRFDIGDLAALAGQTLLFKSWYLEEGGAFPENLGLIQTVEVSLQ